MGVHVAVFLSSAGYSCAADISWEQGFKVPNAQGTDWWLRAMGHSMDSSQTSPEVPFPDVGSGQVRITWLTNQSYPDPRVRGRSPSFLVPHNWRNIPGRDFLLMPFSFAVSVTNYACPYDEVLKAIDWVEVSLTGSWGLFGSVASYMSDPNSRVEGCTFRRRCDEITKCSKMSSWA